MRNKIVITGRIVEIGRFEKGDGVILDINGAGLALEIYGLSDEQLKACAQGFDEEATITIIVPSDEGGAKETQ